MGNFAFWCAVAMPLVAGCGPLQGRVSPGSPPADLESLTLEPANIMVDIDPTNGYSAAVSFTAFASFSDGSKQEVTSQVSWLVDAPAAIIGGQATVNLIGSFKVNAQLRGISADAMFTTRLQGSGYGTGFAPGDGAKLDGSPSTNTSIAYPMDGT